MFEDFSFEGRWVVGRDGARLSAPAGSFSFSFEGRNAYALIEGDARWKIRIDGEISKTFASHAKKFHPIAENLSDGVHRATVSKMTETEFGSVSLCGVKANVVKFRGQKKHRRIEFIGDSYTVGYGNTAESPISGNAFSTTDATQSYGALIADKLGAEFAVNAYSGRGLVQNFMGIAPRWTIPKLYRFALGGEAALRTSPPWDFDLFSPQTVCVFVGINDFQGEGPHPSPEAFDSAYAEFLDFLRSRHSQANFILLSTDIFPTNPLPERVETVLAREISKGNRDVSHLFLETPGNRGLDFHPDVERHRLMANALYQKILNISPEI